MSLPKRSQLVSAEISLQAAIAALEFFPPSAAASQKSWLTVGLAVGRELAGERVGKPRTNSLLASNFRGFDRWFVALIGALKWKFTKTERNKNVYMGLENPL